MSEVKTIKKPLIINSPFKAPEQHWKFNSITQEFDIKPGRRKAGYVVAKPGSYEYGGEKELELTNRVRTALVEWQKQGRPGLTPVSRHLLEFWHQNSEKAGRRYNFFFCQLEAIETLMFLLEGRDDLKQGFKIDKDNDLVRWCCKMATGTGKTVVMAMAIVWQVLNKVLNAQDARFSKHILVVAPNLTVLERLKQALQMRKKGSNYYQIYKLIPSQWVEKFNLGAVKIINWHQLQWSTEEQVQKRKSVVQKGIKSDAAYAHEILSELSTKHNIVVFNDEAHHAWRKTEDINVKISEDITKEDEQQATKWIAGLDRINKVVGINKVFDFSATPYIPASMRGGDVPVFKWIVSDFGLMDAIESGLVKTPKFAVGDDASVNVKTKKPRLHHIYEDEDVKPDLSSKKTLSTQALPSLIKVAYKHLALSWQKKYDEMLQNHKHGVESFVPPVMISVVNSKKTADRIENGLSKADVSLPEAFQVPSKMLKVYSNLDSDKDEDRQERLRTVGQVGKRGHHVQHVISVAMLSEGWNCKTVTHIMGLRAFSSQLLCEQTVGRGLRRTDYELNDKGLFDSEYVYVLGVPFAYLPQQGDDEKTKKSDVTKRRIHIVPEKSAYKIEWPNVERIDSQLKPQLDIDWKSAKSLVLDVSSLPRLQQYASVVEGQNYKNIEITTLQKLLIDTFGEGVERMQNIILNTANRVYDELPASWKDRFLKTYALEHIFKLVQKFIESKIRVNPPYEKQRKDLVIMIEMDKVVRKVWHSIQISSSNEILQVIYDPSKKILSTQDMTEWWTKKDVAQFKKIHTNLCAVDSSWEYTAAQQLDQNQHVMAWVKNDHLDFRIAYVDEKGTRRTYTPDFIVKLANGTNLILEVKGLQRKRDPYKWDFMQRWCQAVSQDLGETWCFEVSKDSTGGEVNRIVDKLMSV